MFASEGAPVLVLMHRVCVKEIDLLEGGAVLFGSAVLVLPH